MSAGAGKGEGRSCGGGEGGDDKGGAGLALKRLRSSLPSMVDETPDLGFYSDDIVLEDTINGVTLRGATAVKVRVQGGSGSG